jgi:hypothetical protein
MKKVAFAIFVLSVAIALVTTAALAQDGVADQLVSKSPWKGTLSFARASVYMDLIFTKTDHGLAARIENSTSQLPTNGPVSNLAVDGNKISFTSSSGGKYSLRLEDGRLDGTVSSTYGSSGSARFEPAS